MVRKTSFLLLIMFIFLATSTLAAVGDGACVDRTGAWRTSCYGIPIDSLQGFGAVELCEDCYVCGLDDGVCPEDFYVEGFSANCSNCADPDCLVTVEGYVTAEDTANIGINGAEITAQVLHLDDWASTYTVTTSYNGVTGRNGHYTFLFPRGNYRFSASKFGYETRLVRFPLDQGKRDNYTLNFTLGNGECHVDCSGYVYDDDVPRCNADCAGFSLGGDTCTFASSPLPYLYTSEEIAEACNGMPVNATVPLRVIDEDLTVMVQCCEGSVGAVIRPRVELQEQFDRIKNLIKRVLIAEKSDESGLVKVNIVIYNKAAEAP